MRFFFMLIQLTFGALLVSFGIETILSPNGILDGGVTGISIMLNATFHIPIWIPFSILNLFFLLFTSSAIGRAFFYKSLYANIITALFLYVFSFTHPLTHSELLTVLYGGISVGLGAALVIRHSGAIDGTEMLSIWIHKRFPFSISTILFGFNLIIFIFAAFLLSTEKAMYSAATFYVVTKTIDFVLDGFNKAKSIFIISKQPHVIGEKITQELGISITYLYGEGGFTGEENKVIYCIADRFTYPKLKEIILDIDPTAIIEASYVTETTAKRK